MESQSENRQIRFAQVLGIEAYRFQGVEQKFPNHFHPYYVVGLIEYGERRLRCQQMEWLVGQGDLLLFQPLMNHACEPVDGQPLDYLCLNIKPEVMDCTARALDIPMLEGQMIVFSQPVVLQPPQDIAEALRGLHQSIMDGEDSGLFREEMYCLLMERILSQYGRPADAGGADGGGIAQVCGYLEEHYGERITLDDLGSLAGMGKYRLIREFTRKKGITPYRYLEAMRVNTAKRLLEQGTEPVDAAAEAGFSDQSHFTNAFKSQIGLTPKQYQRIFKM